MKTDIQQLNNGHPKTVPQEMTGYSYSMSCMPTLPINTTEDCTSLNGMRVQRTAYSQPNPRSSSTLSNPPVSVPVTQRVLTHWGRDKMDAISQTTFPRAFSSMKIAVFWMNFHWNMFARVQLTIIQHWFRYWLGADQATSHYLNQWWIVY